MIAFLAAVLVTASPASIAADLVKAQSGDTIVLSGAYPSLTIKNRSFAPMLTIDATAATIGSVVLDKVTGLTIKGGSFGAPKLVGVSVDHSTLVTITGVTVTGSEVGVTVKRSADIAVTGSTFVGMTADGIDIASAQRVVIQGNLCRDNVSDAAHHPDCVQIFNMPNNPAISADVTIEGNIAIGNTQCFSSFNGPSLRLRIIGNLCATNRNQGIALYNSSGSEVRGNTVWTLPGAQPGVVGMVHIKDSPDAVACANAMGGASDAARPC